MPELLNNLLESSSFIPHGHCYLWQPGLVSLHIVSDLLIAIAYFSIPILLVYFVSKRRDVPFDWVFLLFGAFILACGTGHLMDVWTLWYPTYWLSGLIKALTAAISLLTAFQLVPLIPLLLALPSPAQLEAANQTLKKEITERVVAQSALRASQARLAGILDIAEDAIISVDEQMCIQLFNQGAEKIFGYTAPEVIGQSLDLLIPAPTGADRQHIEGFANSAAFSGQLWGNRRNGGEFPAEVSISRLELPNEKILTIILRDISDRFAAEAAVRESEQRFRTIFEGAVIGMALIDRQGQFTQSNPALQTILGYSSEQLCQMAFTDVTHPEDVAIDLHFYQELMAGTRQHYQLEQRYISSSGESVWGRLTASVVEDQHREPQFIITMIEDITERKYAEAALRQSEQQLRQQTQQLERTLQELQQTQSHLVQSEKMSSLGQLVAGVAHEINNPVNFIYGNLIHASQYIEDLQMLLHLYDEHYPNPVAEIEQTRNEIDLDFVLEDLPKLLASMKIGAVRIRQIVLGLRNFSRFDEAEMKPVDVHEGIDNTLLLLQHRLKAKVGPSSIQIIKEYGKLPLVECYVGQLNQVFMNLLANAIDALEEVIDKGKDRRGCHLFSHTQEEAGEFDACVLPTIKIRTEVLSCNQVIIRIADNGPGMTEEVRRKLFDPFFTTKPTGVGTGLGLSISYQIVVEKHGGYLKCLSTPGQGAEFIIQIPIQQHDVKCA